MPIIMPIKALRDTGEISELAHKEQEPIVMSSELYDKFARINRIDQAIYESEQEAAGSAEALEANAVFEELEKKYFG